MKVLAGQNIFDVAVQHAGSVEAAFDLAITNDISLSDALTVGEELLGAGKVRADIVDYYARRVFNPATDETLIGEIEGGIEFMGIEIDFIVS